MSDVVVEEVVEARDLFCDLQLSSRQDAWRTDRAVCGGPNERRELMFDARLGRNRVKGHSIVLID